VHVTKREQSPFLKTLNRAAVLAASTETRGAQRGGGEEVPLSPADILTNRLDATETSVTAQINTVRNYLRQHADLLHLLDRAMEEEFAAIEQRMQRYTLISNVVFTILGTFLGLAAPFILALLGIFLPSPSH
jgi:hypothetical protein